jgi:hypothetical protein
MERTISQSSQRHQKIAIFLPRVSPRIHRKDQPFLLEIRTLWSRRAHTPQSESRRPDRRADRSYERRSTMAERVMDEFERHSSTASGRRGSRQIHVVKRRVTDQADAGKLGVVSV